MIPTPDDVKFLARRTVAPQVVNRILMERAVIRKAVSDLLAANFRVGVDYMEGDEIEHTDDIDKVMEDIMACDEERLRVVLEDGTWFGNALLVYGNDGWDVIADYHVVLEPHLKGANDLADYLCEHGHLPFEAQGKPALPDGALLKRMYYHTEPGWVGGTVHAENGGCSECIPVLVVRADAFKEIA